MAIHACNIAFVIAFAFVTHFTIPNTTCCAFAMSSSMIVTIPQSAFATIWSSLKLALTVHARHIAAFFSASFDCLFWARFAHRGTENETIDFTAHNTITTKIVPLRERIRYSRIVLFFLCDLVHTSHTNVEILFHRIIFSSIAITINAFIVIIAHYFAAQNGSVGLCCTSLRRAPYSPLDPLTISGFNCFRLLTTFVNELRSRPPKVAVDARRWDFIPPRNKI